MLTIMLASTCKHPCECALTISAVAIVHTLPLVLQQKCMIIGPFFFSLLLLITNSIPLCPSPHHTDLDQMVEVPVLCVLRLQPADQDRVRTQGVQLRGLLQKVPRCATCECESPEC